MATLHVESEGANQISTLRTTQKQRGRKQGGITGRGFMPGKSGNIGGRPRGFAVMRDLARQKTEKAINTLVSIMDGRKSPANARVAAAVAVLDRGWGRPTQELSEGEPSSKDFDFSKLTRKELNVLEQLLEKATTNGTNPPTTTPQRRVKQ